VRALEEEGWYAADGGWGDGGGARERERVLSSLGLHAGAACQIDELALSDLAADDRFAGQYARAGRPLIVRGAGADGGWERARWARGAVLEAVGRLRVPSIGTVPYPAAFGKPIQPATFAEFIDAMPASAPAPGEAAPQYLFIPEARVRYFEEALPAARAQPSREHVSELGLLSATHPPLRRAGSQVAIGPAGSGSPFHFHNGALNALGFGEKRWLLLPPAAAQFSAEDVWAWATAEGRARLAELAAAGELLQCDQRAGDLLFVPKMWGHAVVNTRASVGVAVEFSAPWEPG
jgi:hypothetical protein